MRLGRVKNILTAVLSKTVILISIFPHFVLNEKNKENLLEYKRFAQQLRRLWFAIFFFLI